jgi:NhaP-type Na+/H+ or K+/H+ antiporter
MEAALIIAIVGVIFFLSHLFSGIFNRTKIPDVLFLFIIGLIFGPIFNIIKPSDFGALGSIFTTITLVIILFESGTGLNLDNIRKTLKNFTTLTIFNFVATMIMIGFITSITTGIGLARSFLLGAILGGTSSAIVIPLLKQIEMEEESKTILILESVLSDVLCIVSALAIIEAYKIGENHFGFIIGNIISSFSLAAILGIMFAYIWSLLLNKIRTIQNSIFTTLAFVFVVFGIVEFLGFSGAIASLAFGVTIANIKKLKLPLIKRYISLKPTTFNETEKIFFSEIVFILKTFFFVYVGLSIQITNLWLIIFGLIITVLIFILRIPVVRFSIKKSTPKYDTSIMAVTVPKGLAAAVLASIPLQQGIERGDFIQNTTYSVLLFSIILTSLLVLLVNKTHVKSFYYLIFSGYKNSNRQKSRFLFFIKK